MTLRVLTSFHYYRGHDMNALVTDLRARYGGPVEVFADSGAYSAATLGKTVSLTDYTAWLRQWRSVITTAATLDVIGDHEATARNTAALSAAGLDVLPVFHVGTPWPVLQAMCARHPYIALGGMVPHANNPKGVLRWLIHAFKIARPHGAVFHGFGQTTHDTNAALPFYSVDSSSWGAGSRYGRTVVWDDRAYRLRTIDAKDPDALARAAHLITAHGIDPLALRAPGFGQRAHREKPAYDAEREMSSGSAADAWQRYAAWLQTRHRVPPPPGHTDPGTVIYLADTFHQNLIQAATHLGKRRAPA